MAVEITNTRKLKTGKKCTAGELRELLTGVPDTAEIDIDQNSYSGDFREPGYTTTTLTVDMTSVKPTWGPHGLVHRGGETLQSQMEIR